MCRIVVCMGSMAFSAATELGDALRKHGASMTPQAFLDVLREVSGGSSEHLTAGERDFLLASGDLTEEDLTEDALTESLIYAAKSRTAAEDTVIADSYATAEVAELLDRAESNVRRSRLQGDLYGPAETTGRTLHFPRWQFVEGTVVPGLRQIIPALPRYWHPLSVERFMETPHEDLDGLAPVRWLTSGGSIAAVAELADEQGHE